MGEHIVILAALLDPQTLPSQTQASLASCHLCPFPNDLIGMYNNLKNQVLFLFFFGLKNEMTSSRLNVSLKENAPGLYSVLQALLSI